MTCQPEHGHDAKTAERAAEASVNGDQVCATLREHVRRRLPGGGRRLAIEISHDPATVVLTGFVASFYAKQILYQICRGCAPDFHVIDTTVVGDRPKKRA